MRPPSDPLMEARQFCRTQLLGWLGSPDWRPVPRLHSTLLQRRQCGGRILHGGNQSFGRQRARSSPAVGAPGKSFVELASERM
jgi:hypothetical protein